MFCLPKYRKFSRLNAVVAVAVAAVSSSRARARLETVTRARGRTDGRQESGEEGSAVVRRAGSRSSVSENLHTKRAPVYEMVRQTRRQSLKSTRGRRRRDPSFNFQIERARV